MISAEQRQQAAIAALQKLYPERIEEMRELSAAEQQQQWQWALDDEAEDRGLQSWELVLELTATSPEELQQLRRDIHQETAEALGLGWEEYCGFNELDPDNP